MKKQMMKLGMVAAVIVGGLNVAHAADGTIHFIGSVNAGSCTIDVPEPNVDLGSIEKSRIASGAPGDKLGTPATFNINLSDCDAGKTNAVIKFGTTTDADVDHTAAFKLNGTSTAAGVGVTLWDANNTVLQPGVAAPTGQTFTDTTGGTLTYLASYMVTKPASAKDGSADADIDFTIAYP